MTAEERLQQSIQTLSQAGLDPAKLKNWQGASNSTPECLSLPELRKLPYIAEERQDHVEGCEFCQFMLKVLLPEQEEIEAWAVQVNAINAEQSPQTAQSEGLLDLLDEDESEKENPGQREPATAGGLSRPSV
jgi:hypothetical protein